MILTIDQYKTYLPANTLADAYKLEAFEMRALYKHLLRYLGQRLTDIVAAGPDPDNDGETEEIFIKVAPALANLAYLESIPFFNVILTSSGFGVVSNQNIAPASMERVRDLKDACLQAANHYTDQLLAYLETSDDGLSGSGSDGGYFSLWNQCSINSGSLVENATVFNLATGLFITRHQFVDLIPFITVIESTTISQALSPEFLLELADGDDTLVKPLVCKSISLLAYSQYLQSRNDAAPGLLSVAEVSRNQADLVMKRALSLLKSNLASYPTYETYGYEAPYDNDDFDDDEDSAFFIAGATA